MPSSIYFPAVRPTVLTIAHRLSTIMDYDKRLDKKFVCPYQSAGRKPFSNGTWVVVLKGKHKYKRQGLNHEGGSWQLRILVLSAGRRVEYDSPFELMSRPDSHFARMLSFGCKTVV